MIETSVFMNNRTQAVRLPTPVRFDNELKKVAVRVVGKERILAPIDQTWNSFFLSDDSVDSDFLATRETPNQPEREGFE